MNVANIVDRLAALDHELGRLEALRALAQSNANTSEVARLEVEIDHVRKTRDALRDELKALTWLKTAYGDSGFATGFFRYLPSGATGPLSVTLRVTPVSRLMSDLAATAARRACSSVHSVGAMTCYAVPVSAEPVRSCIDWWATLASNESAYQNRAVTLREEPQC